MRSFPNRVRDAEWKSKIRFLAHEQVVPRIYRKKRKRKEKSRHETM